MKIIINNSNREKTIFYLKDEKDENWEKKEVQFLDNPSLIAEIEEVLKCRNKKIGDLSGVAVVLGHGGFTGERIATTVANSLGYALGIKVIGITKFIKDANQLVDEDFNMIDEKFKISLQGVYISAKYSGDANIGKNK